MINCDNLNREQLNFLEIAYRESPHAFQTNKYYQSVGDDLCLAGLIERMESPGLHLIWRITDRGRESFRDYMRRQVPS